jgi:hypothetical protein
MRIEIRHTDRNGASCMRTVLQQSLYDTLIHLRQQGVKTADAWEVDEAGGLLDRIGEIEATPGQADDRRIRYQVWADSGAN